jgi:hypothetical protein
MAIIETKFVHVYLAIKLQIIKIYFIIFNILKLLMNVVAWHFFTTSLIIKILNIVGTKMSKLLIQNLQIECMYSIKIAF